MSATSYGIVFLPTIDIIQHVGCVSVDSATEKPAVFVIWYIFVQAGRQFRPGFHVVFILDLCRSAVGFHV